MPNAAIGVKHYCKDNVSHFPDVMSVVKGKWILGSISAPFANPTAEGIKYCPWCGAELAKEEPHGT